jgi:hypothetical protein
MSCARPMESSDLFWIASACRRACCRCDHTCPPPPCPPPAPSPDIPAVYRRFFRTRPSAAGGGKLPEFPRCFQGVFLSQNVKNEFEIPICSSMCASTCVCVCVACV